MVAEDVLVAVPEAVSDEAAAQALINPVPVIAMFQGLAVPKGGWVGWGGEAGRWASPPSRHDGMKVVA